MVGRQGRTVAEAAKVLGISPEAVRKRIARGTLEADKLDGETWTVYLDDGAPSGTSDRTANESHFWELIQNQKQEIERLQQELEREKARVDLLIERIPPQLPAPEQAATRENWWQRLWSRK